MKNIKDIFEFFICARPNSPQTKRGANGKFLPKPLLFHLRHPNSKTNEPKFWQILSPKNCFAKTSSALFRHLPEYLEGRTPKEKHPFLFQKKFHPRQIRNARSVFSFGVAEALRGSGGTIHSSLGFCSKYIRTLSNTHRILELARDTIVSCWFLFNLLVAYVDAVYFPNTHSLQSTFSRARTLVLCVF
jgi:hypothetical protein